ncbi:MAG: hypothetical protein AAF527_07695 [Pseudomonadota bacterium]
MKDTSFSRGRGISPLRTQRSAKAHALFRMLRNGGDAPSASALQAARAQFELFKAAGK